MTKTFHRGNTRAVLIDWCQFILGTILHKGQNTLRALYRTPMYRPLFCSQTMLRIGALTV